MKKSFFIFLLLLLATPLASAQSVSIGDYSVVVDSEITVPITISDAETIAGGVINISFNSSIVTIKDVMAGDFGTPVANVNNTDGWVKLVAASVESVNKSEAVLANLVFNVSSVGTSDIRIVYVSLNDESGGLIIPIILNGSITANSDYIPRTITVSSSDEADYTSIQAAINASEPGDTIEVYSGTYFENVNVNKQLILRGVDTGDGNPMVNGNGDAITLNADGITLDGFTAINASSPYAGINVISNNNMISGNTASDNYRGIELSSSNNNTLSSNTVSNNSNTGITLWYSSNNTLSGNTASNNYLGIFLYSASNNTLSSNTVSNNLHAGICLSSSSNNTLSSSIFTNDGLSVYYSYKNNIVNNTVNNKTLLYLENKSDIIIQNAGQVILVNSNNITVEGLILSNTSIGIELWNTNDCKIINNTASNNSWSSGIYLGSSSNNTLSGNTVSNNYRSILLDFSSSNNTLSNNTALNNIYGIQLSSSSNNRLSDNTASNNLNHGIWLIASSNNMLRGNTASNNYRGIELYSSSSNNILYHNNLVDNTNNAYDYNDNNQWDWGTTGNYYSDYTGTDSNGDGIGDTPYPIPGGNNVDNYPLMASWATAPTNGSVHNINKATNYSTIQAAIDDASPGDEIHVDSGTYYENVNVTKQLTLRGIDTGIGMPIVHASDIELPYSSFGFSIIADGVILDGFEIVNSTYAGVSIGGENCKIINNKIIPANLWGVVLFSNNSIIDNNIIVNAKENISIYVELDTGGILNFDGSFNYFGNNTISNGFFGISDATYYMSYGPGQKPFLGNLTVFNNTINGSINGISLYGSNHSQILRNRISNSRELILGDISIGSGIILYSNNCDVKENEIIFNKKSGISIVESNQNTLSNNNISNNEIGIVSTDSTNNLVYHNNIFDNILLNSQEDVCTSGGCTNFWDNGTPSGGNYWGDYNGIDANNDGIGDTPHNISGSAGAQDRYPFMKENGWLENIKPPSGITDLQNITYAQTSINWTWTNPDDIDFSHVMVYLNSVFQTNITLPINYYNATNLTADAEYTISTHTVDLNGNINQTWINHTARTAPLPDTTPPATVTGLQNVTRTQTSINWTWQNPSDFDFNHTVVYIGGLWKTNTSNNYYNLTGLLPNTTHTISTRTVDINGNINLTWINDTATTLPVPDTVLPIITIISPVNDTTYNIDSVDLNYSVNEPTAWQGYSLDGETTIILYENTTLTGLIDGLHTLTIYANDTSGNMNSSMVFFMIDTTPPSIISVTLNNTLVKSGALIEVTINATDENGIDTVTADGIPLTLTGEYYVGTITANVSPVTVNVTDEVGNIATDTSATYIVDDTEPIINSITLNDTLVKTGTPIEVTVNATDENGIDTVTADGIPLTLIGEYYVGTITADTSPVTVNVTDEVGNLATDTSATYIVDDIKPIINTVTLNITTPKIGEDILLTVNATDNFAVTSVEANDIALVHQLGNNWTGTITAIEGTHPVNISARDAAGNVGWDNSTSYTATLLDTTPPASVTNIHSAAGESWINWAWTNPSNPDFNHTLIYIDGSFAASVSETYYNATALLQGTLHTIGTRTVDLSGNVNETWVNDSATTKGELPGGLSIKILKPSSDSFYPVGETVEFNATVTDQNGNPVASGISAYADFSGPDSTSRHVILSEDAGNFVGEYTVKGEDARGIWTVNINAFNATSSGQASLKLFFTGAYFIQPYTDSRSYLLGETANFTAKVVKPVGSSQPLTDKNLSLNLSVYLFNTTTLVSGPVEMVFDNTTEKFHGNVNTGLLGSGLFSVVFSGNDTDGNIETKSLTIGVSEDFNIIVGTDKTCYDRNEPVNIHGSMEFIDGSPLSNTDVNLRISLKGFIRSYTATTNETGGFNYTFQPFAAEAGNYTITSTAVNMGLQRTAESYFTIHGLYLAPPSGTLDMVENSSQDIDFILYNLGETTLTGITATVSDHDTSDNVDATIITIVPNELHPSESVYITLNVSAGTPVPENAAFSITISTDQMSDETSELDVNLFSPNPVVVLEPDNIAVGLNQNQTALKTVTISNTGYGILRNLTLSQPDYNWMRINSNTTIGDLKPGENTSFDIHIHTYNVSLGTYHDTVGITSDNHESMVVDLTASITDQTYGSLLFYVENELGQNISGASISLIDDTLYQEYTAITNSTGYALINDLPTGRYIYEVSSSNDNTLSQLNSVVVEPMEQPKRVNVTMQLSFIDFEWDVTPSTIDDWYQIVLKMTFETDVPVPIIVAFPPHLEYDMNPGDVQSGTLTVANLGLVSLFDVSITPYINNNVQFTPIVSHIEELKAKSSVQIPYTIELAPSASSCDGFTGKISINGKYIHFINGEGVASYTGTTVSLVVKTPTCQPPAIGTGTVIGTVTDASDGSQIDNARVVAYSYSDYTDSSGSYTLVSVKSGTYTITAYKDGYYPASKTVVVTKDTTETVNFQLKPIKTGPITGIVTNANDGTLIEGARVAAGGHSDATDNTGSYTLSGVLTGSHTITASKRGFYTSSTTVLVSEDNTAVVNFQLTPIPETVVLTGSVSGIVTDIDSGEALPFALVVTNGGFDFTDESGGYTITGVPVGNNRVRASKMWYHSASKTVQVYEDCTTIVNFQLKKIIIPPIPIPDCECISGTPPVIWVYKGPDFGLLTPPPTTPSKMFVKNCNDEGTIEFSDAYGATISLTSLWTSSLLANIGMSSLSAFDIPVEIWYNEFIPEQIDPNEETMLDVENMGTFFSDMESFGITLPIPDVFGGALGFVYGPYPYDASHDCLKIIPLGGMEIKEGSINIVFPPWPPWPPLPPYHDGDSDDGPGPVPPWRPPVFTETIHEIVQLSISQNATMERDAFWAGLGIRNRMPDTNIDNVGVSLHISDENGSANDKFFIRAPRLEDISDIDGSGSISPLQLAKAQWLIIPKPGAGGVSGQTYNISADITYSVDGNNFRVTTEDVEILVKPQPQLILDYYLPSDVIGNKPFKLAVMVTNDGYSTARNFSIETAQPVIYNPSGLMIDFEIIRSALQGEERSDSLKINFGDLSPGESKLAWWEMVVSMDGTFTEFTGDYTHSSELGGMETSLIKQLNTNIIHREIETGDVNYRFLVTPKDDETYYLLLDPDSGGSTPVSIADCTVVSGPTPGNPNMDISIEDMTGQWVIVSINDPYDNKVPILKVIRDSDGSEIPFYNYWMRDGRILIVDHYTEGFDGKYTVIFDLPGSSSLTRTPVEYTSLGNVDLTLYSFDYDNPSRSDYMIVVSPLLAQAFVAEETTGDKEEIQNKINDKANQTEDALKAVLEKHKDMNPYILFVDNELRYESNVEKLRADVYGLPFVKNGRVALLTLPSTLKPSRIITYADIVYGDPFLIGDLKYGFVTKNVWEEYKNIVTNKAVKSDADYVLILGSAKEFPEYKTFAKINVLDVFDPYIFSDSYYVSNSNNNYVARVGRLPLQFAYNYSSSPQQFSKIAWIHNAEYMGSLLSNKLPIPIEYDIYSQIYVNKLVKPIFEKLEEKEGYKGQIKWTPLSENHPDPMVVDLEYASLFVAGWHGNTRRVGAHGGDLVLQNVHPLIFVSTSCDGSNTGDYEDYNFGYKLGNPNDLFSSILLSNGSSYIGNTGYANGKEAPEIVVDFIGSLISEKNLGDSWLQTIKNFDGSDYSRDQFRLLGDPALDTSALDDPLYNNISTLPPQFSISINTSYNETPINGHSLLSMNLSINSSQNITYTLKTDQFATGTGAPIVPTIYIGIPMPVNQTIDDVTVVFDNSYTTSINLVEYISYLLTPDGAEVIPDIEIHGDYPSVNFTYSLITIPDERLLKIQAIPVKYNIDSQIAELYRSINVTVHTKPFVEENITAKVHIDLSLDYLALHQNENTSLIISLYNDYSATENATDVSVTAEIPDNLEIISASGTINGTINGHTVIWDVNNLTTSGVNSFKSVELVIQAPASIPDMTIEQINLTATYSNESGGVYEPTEVPILVCLIPPDYVDLTVSNMVIHRPLKLGTPTNVTAVISNNGDIGITCVSVKLLIDGNESSGLIIDTPAKESQSVNLSIGGLSLGKHQIATIVQPIGIETNLTNNIVTEDVDIYFAMLPPLSTTDLYNLSYGSTLPIGFTVRDNETYEFISDNTVNVSILNSTNYIITSFNATRGVLIDSEEGQYTVDFNTMNHPELTFGETYAVSVTFGEGDALLSYATAYFILEENLSPPYSITDLCSTIGTTWLNFTWTNPSDLDFNHTELYFNGTFLTNIPAPQNYHNITGLLPDTSYELSTRTVDTSGNINETWVNATARTLPLADTTPPIITFTPPTDPGDTTLTTRNWTFINVSLSEPGFSWLEWNGINESMSGSGTHWYINRTGLDNGVYTYRVWANDSAGNVNVSETRAIEIDCDTLPPVITIISPVNGTIYNTDSVDLNYSVNEPTTWQGYSLDGAANITLHGNTTLTGFADGLHTLSLYANDTSGNMNSSTIWFAIDTTAPVVNTVTLNTTLLYAGEHILVTVNAIDNIAVTSVEANGVALSYQSDDIWSGTIIAIAGTHTVNVSAIDTAGNVGWNNSTSYTATTQDTTPPATISNLHHTAGPTWLNWTWTNPLDPDFNHTRIYLNGIFRLLTSAGHYNATDLTPGTEYTISTRTVDVSGNLNATWENNTAVTLAGDAELPVIESVSLDAYTTIANTTIHVAVNVTDNIGVVSVTADSVSLIQAGNNWSGILQVPTTATIGTYSVVIQASDAAGNTAESTANYTVVTPQGGVGIDLIPTDTTVDSGMPVTIMVKVTNTENFDDMFNVELTYDNIPAEYSDYKLDFNWTDWLDHRQQVSIKAKSSTEIPLTITVPAGEAGYKLYSITANSMNWITVGSNTGGILVNTPTGDTTSPSIESVVLDNPTTIANTTIPVTVNATDNVGVTSVTADDISLTQDGNSWMGEITVPSTATPGTYPVTIQVSDAAGNVAESTATYTVVTPQGGVGIDLVPTDTVVSSGSSVTIMVKVTNTENFDDAFNVELTYDNIPPEYSAYMLDFNWADWPDNKQQVSVNAKSLKEIPFIITVPVGESGYKLYSVTARSTKWITTGSNTGGILID